MNQKDKISDFQLLFSIGCFIQGSTLLSSFVLVVTKQDSWFVVFTGFIASLFIIGIYILLVNKYPNQSLVQIHDSVYGPVVGKVFSAIYFVYFLSLASLNSMDVGNFIVGYIMPETPIIVVLTLFVMLCAYAVNKGIASIVRLSFLFVAISGIVVIFIFVVLLHEMNMDNFLPSFTLPPIKYVQGTHIIAAIPLCEILAFMMVVQNVNNQKKIAHSYFFGLLIGVITLSLIILRDIAVLGNLLDFITLPSFEVVKLVDIANVITRMEVLYAIELLLLQFFKVSILFYAAITALQQIFGLSSHKPFVTVVGVVIISFALTLFDSGMENAYWGSRYGPFYNSFFQLVLPVITLITAYARDLFNMVRSKAH